MGLPKVAVCRATPNFLLIQPLRRRRLITAKNHLPSVETTIGKLTLEHLASSSDDGSGRPFDVRTSRSILGTDGERCGPMEGETTTNSCLDRVQSRRCSEVEEDLAQYSLVDGGNALLEPEQPQFYLNYSSRVGWIEVEGGRDPYTYVMD
jgi:hypothetical protein